MPGYEASVWYGVVAPKGTSPAIVATLNKAVNAALADPKFSARFAEFGGLPMPMSSSELGKLIATIPTNGARWWSSPEYQSIRAKSRDIEPWASRFYLIGMRSRYLIRCVIFSEKSRAFQDHARVLLLLRPLWSVR